MMGTYIHVHTCRKYNRIQFHVSIHISTYIYTYVHTFVSRECSEFRLHRGSGVMQDVSGLLLCTHEA